MTTLTESTHAGEGIVSEANKSRSRDAITVLSGQTLVAMAVLGMVTVGAATAEAVTGNTGAGTSSAVTVGAGAKAGVYKVTFIEPGSGAGDFIVEDPDGITVGSGAVGTEFAAGGLTFTISDGDPDFAAGDAFEITVAAGSGKYKEWNPANADGSQVACAILFDAVDASDGDAPGVAVSRDAEVNAAELVWFTGATTDNKTAGLAQLATVGIIGR